MAQARVPDAPRCSCCRGGSVLGDGSGSSGAAGGGAVCEWAKAGMSLTLPLQRVVPPARTDGAMDVADDAACAKEAGRLPHERAGLLCLLVPTEAAPMPTGGRADRPSAGATLAVSLTDVPPVAPPSSSVVVVGRVIDGHEELKRMLAASAGDGPARMTRWRKAPAPMVSAA